MRFAYLKIFCKFAKRINILTIMVEKIAEIKTISKTHFVVDKACSIKIKERFGIDDKEKFEEAFKVVAYGVGGESTKIHSAVSSSLLSLLFFYKLFYSSDSELSITIEGVKYNKAFFEVRNKCVGYPSCVDVALLSEDTEDTTLLFLESKLIEYFRDVRNKNEKEYGISYYTIYKDVENLLSQYKIGLDKNSKGIILKCNDENEEYLYGIKQSICHLVGLVQGPQKEGKWDESYLKQHEKYKDAFENAKKIIYGTILFGPEGLSLEASKERYDSYCNLYTGIIGATKIEANNSKIVEAKDSKIIDAIFNWKEQKGKICNDKEKILKKIEILKTPLTYQDIIKENPDYLSKLPEPIKEYYGFNKS